MTALSLRRLWTIRPPDQSYSGAESSSAAALMARRELGEVSSKDRGGLDGLILIVLVLIWWNTRALVSETVSTYWLDADGRKVAEEIYSADRSSATVTYFMKGAVKDDGIYFGPYKDCSIIDYKNWHCPGQELESIDGNVTGSPFDSDRRVHRVSALRYWFARGKQEKDSGK
jgi:hypothetical protein